MIIEGKVDWKGRPARKDKHGGSITSVLLLAGFVFENMATMALAVNLVTYFIGVMHFNLADSANHLTNFMGTGYILCIFVATLADTYIGRANALLISASIEFVGIALLTAQAHFPSLKPPICNIFNPNANCQQVKGANSSLLFISLYLIAAGAAGIKSSLPSHGADQFDEKDPKEADKMSSFFNFLLLALCLGGSVSLTLVVWVQDNKGWDWGFGLSTVAMFLSIVIFVAGLPMYRIHVIKGSSPIVEIIQVYVAAFRNRNLRLPENPVDLFEIDRDKEAATIDTEFLPHRDVLRFLDKAAIQQDQQNMSNPWKLCRVTQVENAKFILTLVPIFCCSIIMTLCLAQLQTFTIQQGLTMDTTLTKSFNIPPATIPILPIVFLIILIPVYDRLLVPLIRRFTSHPTGITHLQRVGVGLVLSAISMATAGLVEIKRKRIARENNMVNAIPILQPLPMSVFWITFQFFIFGIADMFTYVGLLEFFYSQAPKGVKSMSTCFLWSSMALGYFLSTILVKVVNLITKKHTRSGGWLAGNNLNKNHLNLFYFLLAGLSICNFLVYLFFSSRYKYRPQSLELQVEDHDHDHGKEMKKVKEDNSHELKSIHF
ncbi:protein NRT1/ PTR FAMILY 4.5-like [Impatiens glandulifera]|uniref:protein NRT1/ PTR FAMILY 4.5-like n=1 Tax=Impatiens glandulifera TaxID=253017 RepID=UPI001FB0DC9C|nr:protein NRT1/ PTR FAMILY 4.5-like [Impatiens glandulifera]